MQHVAYKCMCAAGWMRIAHYALLNPALVSVGNHFITDHSQNYQHVGVKSVSPEGRFISQLVAVYKVQKVWKCFLFYVLKKKKKSNKT